MRFIEYRHHNRFAIYRDTDGSYCIRDAETVTDAELREGKSSRVVSSGLTWDDVEDFLKGYDNG